MAMRLSFTVDSDVIDMIDTYAKTNSIKREKAILDLIEAGITHMQEGGKLKNEPKRSFEEFSLMKRDVEDLKAVLQDMQNELHLMHHILEDDLLREAGGIPFQNRRWWEFWKV
ncbi:MAG: type II secretion system protein E [Methanoculleus sp. SDB]|nr:MAG: type II secretion system protein E [Methanoculleus sp. SDB]